MTREDVVRAVFYAHEKPELLADILMQSVSTGGETLKADDKVGFGEKTMKDLMPDVKVSWNGKTASVTGNATKISEWSELPQEAQSDLPGHFFAFVLDESLVGKSFDLCKIAADGTEKHQTTDSLKTGGLQWVVKIDNNKKFRVLSDGELIVEYDCYAVTLGE